MRGLVGIEAATAGQGFDKAVKRNDQCDGIGQRMAGAGDGERDTRTRLRIGNKDRTALPGQPGAGFKDRGARLVRRAEREDGETLLDDGSRTVQPFGG